MEPQYFPSDPSLEQKQRNHIRSRKTKNESFEWIKSSVLAILIVLIIRFFFFSPFIVEGLSMEPTFKSGFRLIVNKNIYFFRNPSYGEVIVFHAPDGRDYIKRVIALEGDQIKVEGDDIFINGKKIFEPQLVYAINQAHQEGRLYNYTNYAENIVPKNNVFVMGDNRSNSNDSRSEDVGFIPLDKIVGRAEMIFWPPNKIDFVHF